MAGHASAAFVSTSLADFVVPRPGNRWDSLRWAEGLRVFELDLRRPYGTCNVHPVVVRGAFERLAGVEGPVHILLLLAVMVSRLLS